MHRLDIHTYAGTPREQVTITTDVQGSGSVQVALDGVNIGTQRQFQLKDTPGDQTEMRITLFGATGDSCTVGVSPVDGGTDSDLLLCQAHDPFPVHRYHLLVARQDASDALLRARGVAVGASTQKRLRPRRGRS